MRIDMLGPVHPWRGGIAHYTTRLTRQFEAEGHDVRVINLTRQYPGALFPGSTQRDDHESAFVVDSEAIVDSAAPLTWWRAGARVARRRPDLLVVQWWHPYFAPSFGTIARRARASDIPTVFVCHNVLPHESSPVDAGLARYAFGGGDRFVVHAESEVERLRRLVWRPHVAVSPHPVYDVFAGADTTREAARRALELDGERWLLFFGLIRPYKGLDLLIDALAKVREHDDVRLMIAGEVYGDEAPIRAQIARLGLNDAVRFEPRYLANDEVPVWMAASDAVVLPYRHATQSGIAQVAYACDRAVISTRVGGIPDVVTDGVTGLLVPPEDPTSLAEAIRRFYGESMRDGLERGVRERVASLGWGRLSATIRTGRAPDA